jgi:hypothetical protein
LVQRVLDLRLALDLLLALLDFFNNLGPVREAGRGLFLEGVEVRLHVIVGLTGLVRHLPEDVVPVLAPVLLQGAREGPEVLARPVREALLHQLFLTRRLLL